MRKSRDRLLAAIILAFLLLALPGALSAGERRGAELTLTLKDGHFLGGELIAVKPDSLLLLLAGKDESVDIVGIRSVRISRGSKAGTGGAWGALAGGLIIGISAASDPCLGKEPVRAGIGFGMLGAIPGGLIGLGVGSLVGKYKTIPLEGRSESEVRSALAYLRTKARIRDYK